MNESESVAILPQTLERSRNQAVKSMMQKQQLFQSKDLLTKNLSFGQIPLRSTLSKRQEDMKITSMIRSKVSIYMTSKPLLGKNSIIRESVFKETKKYSKLFSSTYDFPRIKQLSDLVQKQKHLIQTYKQKMQFGFDQCFLFYMDVIGAAVKRQLQISKFSIDKQNSLLIQCFYFVANALVQIGADKLAFYFCVKALRLCEIYQKIQQLGEILFLIGCIARKLQKFQQSIKFFKKSLQYIWRHRSKRSDQKQIQIYNQMSQCLLQINRADQSKIFAYKYQIGYLQKNNSNIIQLSKQLIDSVLKRKSKWHAVTSQSMQLLLQFDIHSFLRTYSPNLTKFDPKKFIDLMKINFQFLYQNFLNDDMFFYEIPMPLEIVSNINKSIKVKSRQTKFLVKKRPNSVLNLKSYTPVKVLKIQQQRPKQFLIFNYRGVKISKHRLSSELVNLIVKIKQIICDKI